MNTQTYVGDELSLFAEALNWKAYWSSVVAPFVRGDVLEVGAGMGVNAALLRSESQVRSWLALEPDPELAAQIGERADEVLVGTVETLGPSMQFDAILYIDVLEHIDDDRAEVLRAWSRLRAGGCLVVLCPAHSWLYSEFDRSIGHFRRHNTGSLRALSPPDCDTVKLQYLDSAGLLASAGNRLVLKQGMPTRRQVQLWDRLLVPCSRTLDRFIGWRLGKSVLAVWRKR
jgi:SAM-dependent methyltransferase